MLYKVSILDSNTVRGGVVLPFRSHEREFIRSELSSDEIETKIKSERATVLTVEAIPISREAFEKSVIRKAKELLTGRPYCLTGLRRDFDEQYHNGKDPINDMAQLIYENSL